MRLIVWTSTFLALSIGGASASSFVSVALPKSSPSIITLSGAPRPSMNVALLASPPRDLLVADEREFVVRSAPAEKLVSISPSVIAFQGLEPSVTSEKVAAVKQSARPFAASTPMVIRGGIVGDPFGTAKPPAAAAANAPAGPAGKPSPVQASASGRKDAVGETKQPSEAGQPPSEQQAADQARPATAAPPSRVVKPR